MSLSLRKKEELKQKIERKGVEENCPICGKRAKIFSDDFYNLEPRYEISCCQCGVFYFIDSYKNIKRVKEIWLVSSYLRYHWEFESVPVTVKFSGFNDWMESLMDEISRLSVVEKVDRFLLWLAMNSDFIGDAVEYSWQDDFTIFQGKNPSEFGYIYEYLRANKWVIGPESYTKDKVKLSLSIDGWRKVEDEVNRLKRKQVFIAMSFDDEIILGKYRAVVKKVCSQMGYDAYVISDFHHNDDIVDKILSEIKRSNFLIVDLTGQKQNAYFEAGYGMAQNKPVILTCLSSEIEKVSFNLNHFNILLWEPNEMDLFMQNLKDRIGATVGSYGV